MFLKLNPNTNTHRITTFLNVYFRFWHLSKGLLYGSITRDWLPFLRRKFKLNQSKGGESDECCHEQQAATLEKNQKYLTLPELMSYLPDFPLPSEILRMVSAREIPFHEINGQYLFKRLEIDGWIEMNTPRKQQETNLLTLKF